jgi:hypothetical protein
MKNKEYTPMGVSEWTIEDLNGDIHILDEVVEEKITFTSECASVGMITAEIKHASITKEFLESHQKGFMRNANCKMSMLGCDVKTGEREDIVFVTGATIKEISIESSVQGDLSKIIIKIEG